MPRLLLAIAAAVIMAFDAPCDALDRTQATTGLMQPSALWDAGRIGGLFPRSPGREPNEHAPARSTAAPSTNPLSQVAHLAGFLLAFVAGTAFTEGRHRLELRSEVFCTKALAVVTRT